MYCNHIVIILYIRNLAQRTCLNLILNFAAVYLYSFLRSTCKYFKPKKSVINFDTVITRKQWKRKATLLQYLSACNVAKQIVYLTLIQSLIQLNGPVYIAQLLCLMLIGLKVLTYSKSRLPVLRVFWLSLYICIYKMREKNYLTIIYIFL